MNLLPLVIVVTVVVTCFVPSLGGINVWNDGSVTASGFPPGPRVVACGPKWPMYSAVYIPGYGWGVCLDRGGGVRGYDVDVWQPDLASCVRFGGKFTAQVIGLKP